MSTETLKSAQENHVLLTDLNADHKTWRSELSLQEDQVDIFERRLGEVLIKNTDHDMQAMGEQFQNKFIRQREIIDILDHDIRAERNKLRKFVEEHSISLDHMFFQDHKVLRDRVFTNSHLFHDLRKKFYKYVENWM